jgi:DNA polymerase-3 subunit gamma/tau
MASLSRKYRPSTFADVTDQDSVKETLRLEVESGKLGHGYLFAGPRGVGKTTIARVFAKAVNCANPTKGEPCNQCDNCVAINEHRAVDVIEMDAASNTGVDNVREAIVEHVRFVPQQLKHKVYILDEAHMLSTSAWNALLKTIEEPPAYAMFILVTTELHKVPATIQSRCQRFDFKRVAEPSLAARVNELASQEGVSVDPEVAKLIARKSDGCVRDAESLLGQILALGEKNITLDVASLVLPLSRLPVAAQILQTWFSRDLGASLAIIAKHEEEGVPLVPLFDDLIEAVRQILLATGDATYKERLATGDEAERILAGLTGTVTPGELADIALMLMERRRDAKQGADARFCLELSATAVASSLLPHAGGGVAQKMTPSAPPPPTTPPPTRLAVEEPPKAAPPIAPTMSAPIVPEPEKIVSTPVTTGEGTIPLSKVLSSWHAFIRKVEEKSPSLCFILKLAKATAVNGDVVTVQFQYAFHRDKITVDMKNKRLTEDSLREATGCPTLRMEGVVGAESASQTEERSTDMVTNILKAFEGQVVEGDSAA